MSPFVCRILQIVYQLVDHNKEHAALGVMVVQLELTNLSVRRNLEKGVTQIKAGVARAVHFSAHIHGTS
jgi:hypothetical protein